MPLASGSRLPPCPALRARNTGFTCCRASFELRPVGLSSSTIPSMAVAAGMACAPSVLGRASRFGWPGIRGIVYVGLDIVRDGRIDQRTEACAGGELFVRPEHELRCHPQ